MSAFSVRLNGVISSEKDSPEDTAFVKRGWHLSDTFDVAYRGVVQECQAKKDLAGLNFSNIKFVIKSKRASSVLTALRIQPRDDSTPLTGRAIRVWLYLHDSALSVTQSQPRAIL